MSVAPFLIGLAGSLHCIGMCGPLSSLITNGGRNPGWKKVYYNAGRIMTYGVLGAAISFLGGLAALCNAQNWISWTVGGLMLIVGITGMTVRPPRFVNIPLNALNKFLKARFAVLSSMKSGYGVLGMGMINGLLPCGITWLALAYCATLRWPTDGFLSMILFGAGTLPAMIGLPLFIDKVSRRLKFSYRSLQTILLIVSGCLLIARTLASPAQSIPGGHGIVVCGSHLTIEK
jgi:sulfite exporter TauE/SafE